MQVWRMWAYIELDFFYTHHQYCPDKIGFDFKQKLTRISSSLSDLDAETYFCHIRPSLDVVENFIASRTARTSTIRSYGCSQYPRWIKGASRGSDERRVTEPEDWAFMTKAKTSRDVVPWSNFRSGKMQGAPLGYCTTLAADVRDVK